MFGLELRDLKESAAPGSVIAPDEWSANFFDKLSAASVAIKSGIRVVRTMRDVLHVPRIDSDPVANFVAEAAMIPATDPAYTDIMATPRKIATRTEVSNELIADSNPDVIALLEKQMTRALALKLDLGVFEGSGVAPEIRGLKNTPGITTTPLGAAPTNFDPFAAAITTLETNNATATAIVTSAEAWGALMLLKEGTGSNKPILSEARRVAQEAARRLYGVPVFITSHMKAAGRCLRLRRLAGRPRHAAGHDHRDRLVATLQHRPVGSARHPAGRPRRCRTRWPWCTSPDW